MPRSLAQRLLIKPGQRILTLNAPADYTEKLGPPPVETTIHTEVEPGVKYDAVHLFVPNKTAVDRDAPQALEALREGGLLWICYPKKSGPMRTDITRDVGWETLGKAGWDAIAQVSIDDTWSALRFRPAEEITYTPGSSRRRVGE